MGALRELFGDSGRVSFGRVGSFIALWFVCMWITRLVWKVADPAWLVPLAAFIGACGLFIGTLYGLSKTGETIQRMKRED